MFDDSLDDLQRIATYSTSKIALQRLVHVKMLTNVAETFPLQVGGWVVGVVGWWRRWTCRGGSSPATLPLWAVPSPMHEPFLTPCL
jgi:hypothetical protein